MPITCAVVYDHMWIVGWNNWFGLEWSWIFGCNNFTEL